MLLFWIILFSLLGSIGSVMGALALLLFRSGIRRALLPCLVSYATGTLLAAAFLGVIPSGLEQTSAPALSATVLVGIFGFFVLERLVLLRQTSIQAATPHARSGPLILIGDGLHNFVDGLVIAAAFLTSIPLGVAASLAVIAHEIPQEVGDFAILLHSGYSELKAFAYNLLSSLATLPGALLGYFFLAQTRQFIPYVLGISAASFIYIAMADLFPSLHQEGGGRRTAGQIALLVAGAGTIALLRAAP